MHSANSTADQEARRNRATVSLEQVNGTVIVEADGDVLDFKRRLAAVLSFDAAREHKLIVCTESEREKIEAILATEFPPLPVISLAQEQSAEHAAHLFSQVKTDKVAFLRVGDSYTPPQWDALGSTGAALMCWVPDIPFPEQSAWAYPGNVRSWVASTELLRGLFPLEVLPSWNSLQVAAAARRAGQNFRWASPRAFSTAETEAEPPASESYHLGLNSSVLALIPHYKCEEWLDECLQSLVAQTRRLDAIVVIDDNSEHPPVEIVCRYPEATLLRATESCGPYRLSQQVINDTDYAAYMFQDADDWSADQRLEILLTEAERTGAEYVGSQVLNVLCPQEELVPVYYPLDVSKVYPRKQGHPIMHPTTLVTRELIQRVGGYSTALRYGADSEFLRRVGFTARIVNSARFCYFQRHRKDSLTSAPETGLGSPARDALMANLRQWAEKNRAALMRSDTQAVKPYAVAKPIRLEHLLGPPLKPAARDSTRPI